MNDNYEIIYGKKYKKCNENQIRNPITKRCIYRDKKVAKYLLMMNIRERPRYLYKYIRIKFKKSKSSLLNIDEKDDRMSIYKKIMNNINKDIKLGYNFIINDKLNYGDDNIYSSILIKNPKYIIASKIVIKNKKSENEIKYLKILNNVVINNICPNFLLYFGNFDLVMKDEDLDILPKLLKVDNIKSFRIILTEKGDGNLKNLLKEVNIKDDIYLNALSQLYISLMFFYKETMSFHNNSIWNNMIYIKIKKGGYYHYEIMGNNYYIENLGYLWMIWDFENSIEFKKSIEKNIMIKMDFEKVIYNFLPLKYNGLIKNNKLSDKSLNKILNVYNVIKYYSEIYSLSGMKIFITKILNILVNNGLIKTTVISSQIINKIPYKLNIK
jgi:hypothetical protein